MAVSHTIRISYFVSYFNEFRIFCCNRLENSYSGVFGAGDDDSEVKLQKLKMVNPIRRSYTQNSINVEFSRYEFSGLTTITQGFSRSLKTVVNSDFEMTDPIRRPYIRFPVKIRKFSSGKLENFYSSVSGITMQLITNLNSAIENSILQSHIWCFDRIHIIPYSFVWKIHKSFSHYFCHKSFFWRFELTFVGIYFFNDIYFF